ncbi:phosphate-starvation-inducible protein PsiE [Serratia ureilytica]|nr:phosphate-starvation-inducible protein PsiE [Serratia ureilytica]MBF8442620.1 phosphate-starvation-inducible protein PsiE [Serratia ureilytica]MBF8444949.1 phosphate-starvation-inducible protein PsiE [Serratia ureilytica]
MRSYKSSTKVTVCYEWIVICASVILFIFLLKETWHLVNAVLLFDKEQEINFAEAIINYFLYFEFLGLIVKYFENNNHFPLRYFVYIGITAMLRLIVVEHSEPFATLVYSLAILIQIIGLFIAGRFK